MNKKFSLSTISTVIEWLETLDGAESRNRETPEQFLKEHFCEQKLFVEKTLEKEIFTNICRHRDFINLLMKATTKLQESARLTVHLHLLIFFLSKSTSSTILDSIKNHFSDDVIKILLGLIDDEHFMMLVQRNGDEDSDKDSFLGNANEVRREFIKHNFTEPDLRGFFSPQIKPLRLKFRQSKLELAAADGIISRKSTACSSIRSTIFEKAKNRPKKMTSTKGSDGSENKLEKILKNFPQTKMKLRVMNFRKNTASVLRAGSLVSSKLKSNDSMVEKLVAGSNDPLEISLQLKEIVEAAHLKELQEIERKHLLGLISLEEAKIAKMEAVKRNQTVAEEIKKERQNLLKLLKQSQEQQMFISKQVIRKTQLGRLKAKKNQFDAVVKNKLSADEVKKLNEKFKTQLNEAKEKELERKTELIHKMKLLEEKLKAGKLERKSLNEYQRMSILELRVSIVNLHNRLDLEKKSRQKKFQQERERQKQLIVNNEVLIAIARKNRQPPLGASKVKRHIEPSPDLSILREKLAEMRRLTSNRKILS